MRSHSGLHSHAANSPEVTVRSFVEGGCLTPLRLPLIVSALAVSPPDFCIVSRLAFKIRGPI
jgi:hypothetical protein